MLEGGGASRWDYRCQDAESVKPDDSAAASLANDEDGNLGVRKNLGRLAAEEQPGNATSTV